MTKTPPSSQTIKWQGISITVIYDPHYFRDVAHLDITSEGRMPLPITETGYRS